MAAYNFNGAQYPSVSTIVGQLDKSDALIPWALNCYEQKATEFIDGGMEAEQAIAVAKTEYKNVSEKALDIGSQVHDAIEKYIKEGKDLRGELKPEVENGFIAFLEWESQNVQEWIESEVRTVHPGLGYGGTLDAIYLHKNGKVKLLDFKTSKSFYDTMYLQVAAYKISLEFTYGEYEIFFSRDGNEMTYKYNLPKISIDECEIVRLDKLTGKPEVKIISGRKLEYSEKCFESLVRFYYFYKKRRLKNNPIVKELWT